MPKKKLSTSIEVPPSDNRWEAENDLRILTDAEEVKKDPERYAAAIKMGRKKIKEAKAVIDAHEEGSEEE